MSEKWKKAILIAFSVLFTLFIGEILLQINYRIKNTHWLWENTAFKLNYIVPTNDRRQYTLRSNYYDIEQNMPINQWGERITPQDERLDNNQNVIVSLGDSVPFGAGNDDTYPFFLAQNLTSEGYKYYVINAGVPSYNLRQSFDQLRFGIFSHVDIEDLKVITIQAANDISLLAYYRDNWTPEVTWADVRFNINPIPFANHLAISHYVSQLISRPKGSNDFNGEAMIEDISPILQEELRILQETQNHIIVLLLPINPFYYQLDNTDKNIELKLWDQYSGSNSSLVDSWDQSIRDYNNVLFDAANDFDNVFFLDLRIAMDKKDRNDLYKDYIHLSTEGNKYQAKLITEYLVKHALIQNRDEQ